MGERYEMLKENMIQCGVDLLGEIKDEDGKLFNMIGELLHELDFEGKIS